MIHKSNHESADRYQYPAHSCLDLLEKEPQINADERRLINSGEETRFLKRNSILIRLNFGMTYSYHNYCK